MTSPPGSARRAGYALPAMLLAVATTALVLAAAVPALQDLGRNARDARLQAQFARTTADAEAWTAYLAMTGQVAQDRLRLAPEAPRAEVRLDDRPYAWRGLALSLQDEAGLFDLNAADDKALRRLFARAGFTAIEAESLADQLLDYRDPDALRRPLGAERRDYLVTGRPLPPDGPLSTARQTLGLAGWPAPPERWAAIADLVTARPDRVDVNLDTAPAAVLETALGQSPSAAAAIVSQRQARPFYGAVRPAMANGPAHARIRLTIRDLATGEGRRSTLVITPRDPERPFRVIQAHALDDHRTKIHAPFPDLRR